MNDRIDNFKIIRNCSEEDIEQQFYQFTTSYQKSPGISSFPAIQETLFFYTEYKKRQFYLDCTIDKIEDSYLKDGKKYKKLFLSCDNDVLTIINKRFASKYDNVFDQISKEEFQYVDIDAPNIIYTTLKDKYRYLIKLIKSMIENPDEFGIMLESYEKTFLNKLIWCEEYDRICEQVLYCLGDCNKINTRDYPVRRILHIVKKVFYLYVDYRFVRILQNIVDKYRLYLSNLFEPTEIEPILKNKYTLPALCSIFSLSNLDRNILSVDLSSTKIPELTITFAVDKSKNFDFTKEIDAFALLSFINLFDSYVKCREYLYINGYLLLEYKIKLYNKISIRERLIGLYIWDRLYLHNENKIKKTIIDHLPEEYFYEGIKNDARRKQGERYLSGTESCIEKGEVLPIMGKKQI